MTLRSGLAALLAALLVAGCGGGDESGTQSFVGKTPTVALYVTWTRDGDELSGSLTQGVLDEGKDEVATKRASLTGKVSGSGVSLDLQQQYGETTRLTGTLHDDVLELEYLSGAAGVETVRMREATAQAFNVALSGLRDAAEQTKADAQTEVAESAEAQRVAEHAQAVLDDIAALKTATDASLPSKPAKYDADVARLRRELASIRANAKAALAADYLSVCSSSSLVQSGVQSLESAVAALERKLGRAVRAKSAVNAAIAKLIDDYSILQSEEQKYLAQDAPTHEEVTRAIRSARRKIRKLGTSKTAVLDDAQTMLEEARRLQTQAGSACRTGGA